MIGSHQQIVTLFEDCDMAPEAIAEQMELDVIAVKSCLTQFSVKYRKACNVEEKAIEKNPEQKRELDFSDSELEVANRVIAQFAADADDQHLQFRAAKYIRQDKKGRLDRTAMKGLNVNVNQFNVFLKQANESVNAGLVKDQKVKNKPVIELDDINQRQPD